jgi:hypothetical protein
MTIPPKTPARNPWRKRSSLKLFMESPPIVRYSNYFQLPSERYIRTIVFLLDHGESKEKNGKIGPIGIK